MTAAIDGRAFASNSQLGQERVTLTNRAFHLVLGLQTSGSNSTIILVTLYNLRGTGTYPLGVGATTYGGVGQVTENNLSWITPLTGNAGTVNITTLTDTRIAGTFSFVAEATAGSTGTRTVTSGQFDYPVVTQGNAVPLADNAGGRVSGTVGGNPFYGALVGSAFSGTTLAFNALTERSYYINFNLANVTGPGTYSLSSTAPLRYILASTSTNLTATWGNPGMPGSTGSVIITSLTASRIVGSFTATLSPNAGVSGTLPMTGTFDIGRFN
jgi:hypothetical protein